MRRPDTGKRAAATGALSAIGIVAVCIVFTYAVDFLTGGEYFISKNEAAGIVNGVPFLAVTLSGGLLAAALAVFFLYRRVYEWWGVYLSVSVFTYIALLLVLIFCIWEHLPGDSPFNRFDFLYYSVAVFPVGAGVGTIFCFLCRTVCEMKEKLRSRKTQK